MVLIGILLSIGASAEDPAAVVQRTYGWWLVRQGQTNTYRQSPQAEKQLLMHKSDFAPELFRLLKAINDMVAEYRAGKRQQLTWDCDPLTWTDSVTFTEPLKARTTKISGKTAVVHVVTRGQGPRWEGSMDWNVDLVMNGPHWQIANLRFPIEGSSSQINMLQELHKNFHS